MSASAHPAEPRIESSTAPADPVSQLHVIVEWLESRDARDQQRHAELHAQLDDALHALELIHDDDPRARRRLRELRAGPSYEAAFTEPDPLVSVVIPTWKSVDTLIERALPSALGQTHPNIEVIVVGDASPPETERALSALADPRVCFHNLTIRGPYEEDHYRAWLASGTPGMNAGVASARGLWIAPLGDDDEFEPDHVARLLSEARDRRLEFVYSRSRVILPEGRETLLGEFPPRLTEVGLQNALFHAGLSFMELELGHAVFDKPNDWGLVHRMMRVGVRIGMIDDITLTYWPSLRAQTPPPGEKPPSAGRGGRLLELESRAAELARNVAELELGLADERERSLQLQAQTADLARRFEQVRTSRSWRLTSPLRRLGARTRRD